MAFLGFKRAISSAHPIRAARFFCSNALKQFMEDPEDYAPFSETFDPEARCRTWNTEEAVHVKIHMPGLGKEDIKVLVENNYLFIRGTDPYHTTNYDLKLQLPEEVFKGCKTEARMMNGLLKVVVQKTTKGHSHEDGGYIFV